MHAYDLDMLPRAVDRVAGDTHGWCFGLPPGIRPEQWPLDPNNGYPLMHGFTLLLPEDYRVHGPDIVALSFFATAPDHNDGGPSSVDEIVHVFEHPDEEPDDPELRPFWQSIRDAHPRLHRMVDILDCAYAVVLLTREEFEGPPCLPPRLEGNRFLAQTEPPRWLAIGAAAAQWSWTYSPASDLPPEGYGLYRALGQIPEPDLAFHRALHWTPRAYDPNAGKAPADEDTGEDGYVAPRYDEAWLRALKYDHIGGTMRPMQAMPEFSPYYIGFEEYFGGYNFGGGNAQLDFRDMRFDWACG